MSIGRGGRDGAAKRIPDERAGTVRLADFIESNCDSILAEWVEFARASGPAGRTMDLDGLRDHAREMLNHIVADLRTPQSNAEQAAKSKGESDADSSEPQTAAEVHGAGRAESGFTLSEMVAEYRALRASVIRLWTEATGTLTRGSDLEDLMRFNEAIDQALAESITRYTDDLNHSKEMFVAILGHDLRSPLGAVIMASQFMLDTGDLAEPHLTLAGRIVRSAKRMNRMVADLLDLTRSRLGAGIPITRKSMDLGREVRHAIDEQTAAHPDAVIQLKTSGDVTGNWDCARISQVVVNLLANAVQHGSSKAPIDVTVHGEAKDVVVRIHNIGPAIRSEDIPGLFSPLKRIRPGQGAAGQGSNNLGLGLYITERIVTAHGGSIEVTSSQQSGTSFSIRLPR